MRQRGTGIRAGAVWVVAALGVVGCGSGPSVGSVSGTVANYAATLHAPAVGGAAPGRPAGTVVRTFWRGPRLVAPGMASDELVVKFRPGVAGPSTAAVHRAVGGQPLRALPRLGVQVVRIAASQSVPQAVGAYRRQPEVQYAEPNYLAAPSVVPSDPVYAIQWHFPGIGLEAAWDRTTGSSSVIVAVIDTGIRASHEDLQGVTVPGFDFVSGGNSGDGDGRDPDPTDPGDPHDPTEPSHGTHVAGTITALTNNGRGGAGVNWGPGGARIMPLRVVGVDGLATFADIAEAVTYATDRGAQVINISLGAPQGSQLLQDAVTYASTRGVLIVAAAGNGGCTGATGAIDFPAAYPQVVAVGAVTSSNLRSSFSDCGPELDVVAPGGSGAPVESETRDWIWAPSWSPEAGHAYFGMVGTSMAAPHVAGLAALLIARGTVGAETLRSRLQGTAQDLGLPGFDTEYGHGKVRADLAVTAPVVAFAADIDGTRIRVRSSRAVVLSTGAFRIPNVVPGNRWVVVWQDVNVNGAVDAGDVFGVSSAPVVVIAGQETTNVAITVGPRGPLDPVLAVDG